MNTAIEPYVFLGRPGAGKGTQAALLIEYLKKQADGERPVLYVETGALLREFIKSDPSYTARLTREVIDAGGGGLTITFLAIYNWTNFFIKNLRGGERVVIDGTPRTALEAEALDIACRFYGADRPTILHLAVSDEWSHERLRARGRVDDTPSGIRQRLSWFQSDVAPVVEYYRTHPDHRFVEINGEQTVEQVHREIVAKLGNLSR